MMVMFIRSAVLVLLCGVILVPGARAQSTPPEPEGNGKSAATAGVTLPTGYVIGPEDVLAVVFWRDKEMSGEVVVRPDGKISLPLLNDIAAAGYTPDQLREQIEKSAAKYVAEPNATVVVKEINSRKVFIVGQVSKPGAFPLIGDMNVLQLIAQAGDVLEYADSKKITVVRKQADGEQRFKFNYKDVLRGRNTEQNIQLKPGDTVIVP